MSFGLKLTDLHITGHVPFCPKAVKPVILILLIKHFGIIERIVVVVDAKPGARVVQDVFSISNFKRGLVAMPPEIFANSL